MNIRLLLVAGLLVCTLPSAFALNCTRFEDDAYTLCNIIRPLPFSESEKQALMRPDLYGTTDESQEEIHLAVYVPETDKITLDDIYQRDLMLAWKLILFFAINHVAFTWPLKSSFLLRWLNVGYSP